MRSILQRVAVPLALGAAIGSCTSGGEGFTESFVLAEVSLVTEVSEDGLTAVGLNLDGRIDDEPVPETCMKRDFTSPDGMPGVDNQLALFGPTLALFGGDPAALIQGAINEGSLLILVELDDLNDYENDDDVTVRLHFGEAPTDVGNDGLLVPGQSFDIKPETISAEMPGQLRDGHLDAGTFDVILPVAVLDQRFNLPIFDGRLSLDMDPQTGEMTGVLGGLVPVEVLINDLIAEIPGAGDLVPLVTRVLRNSADVDPVEGGTCAMMSTAMTVRGVTAFVLRPDSE